MIAGGMGRRVTCERLGPDTDWVVWKNSGDNTMRNAVVLTLGIVVFAVGGCGESLGRSRTKGPALAHNVYFELNDRSPAARARLVADCYTYLKDHPGVTSFAAGAIVESHTRAVNVRDWDVGLHIVFVDKTHHDLYQKAPEHKTFLERNKDNWRTVRVFDTAIE